MEDKLYERSFGYHRGHKWLCLFNNFIPFIALCFYSSYFNYRQLIFTVNLTHLVVQTVQNIVKRGFNTKYLNASCILDKLPTNKM